ncbi:N-6 DNA methylase [Halocatena salina]|uniref:N-6 DNA methylase n=2 Tax=Halocatena salina TaxID=2934340 RepID=A0A8U0A205_9EURY|nr:N-6 DNA methylase [Halocatena salina]UPM43185.1 N-6 DNA methylase [Halocatena salina]
MESHGLTRVTDPEGTVCQLACFNCLLKITLYKLYRDAGKDLQPLSSNTDLYSCLTHAHAETQDQAFKENVLDCLIEPVGESVFAPLLEARHHLINREASIDEVGRIFESLVPQEARRRLGQFRTPMYIAEFMADWAVQRGGDQVLDPGIGAGVLTAAMYDAKHTAEGDAHVDEMWGVDLSELATVMSSTALKLTNGEGSPNFIQDDFMETSTEGQPQRPDQQNPHVPPKMDAVVSNPPYSRSHELSREKKNRINRIAEDEAGMEISQKAPMYHYFFVHAAQFLNAGGRMAFITPARFLETNYGITLRTFLLDHFDIHGMILLDGDIPVFENVDTDPCITFLEKNVDEESNCATTFVRADKWPGAEPLFEAVGGDVQGKMSYGFVNQVAQRELMPEFNWTEYIDPESVDAIPGLKPFREIADIKRGIATGKNDYFCLTQAEVDEWGLNEEYLVPLIRRTKGVSDYDLREHENWKQWLRDGDEAWLLYCYDEDGEPITDIDDPELQAYLEHGEENGAANSYLAQNRTPWYVVDQRDAASILVTYMSKDGFQFIHNKAGVVSLNNLHNVFLDGYEDTEVEALLAYLNSSVANAIAKRSGRTYSRGLHKIEPNELKDLPIVDPDDLSTGEATALSRKFREVCEASRDNDRNVDAEMQELDEKVIEVISPGQQTLDLPRRGTD